MRIFRWVASTFSVAVIFPVMLPLTTQLSAQRLNKRLSAGRAGDVLTKACTIRSGADRSHGGCLCDA